MKRLVPWALLVAAIGASCTLDLAGLPGGGTGSSISGGGGDMTTSTSVSSSSLTTGAGGSTASVSSSASSSSETGGGVVWTRREVLDIDCGANCSFENFPVLVVLRTGRIDYTATRDQGEDLRFTDTSNQPLDHEIELWDEGDTSFVWVRIPKIDQMGSNHTKIRMYYGNADAADAQNPHGVWSATYAGVWHLSQDDNALVDSTGKTATAVNHGSTRGKALIGNGRAFDDNAKQYIDTLNTKQLDRFTVEAWVKGDHDPSALSGPNGPLMREKNYQLMWDHFYPFAATASYNPDDPFPGGQNWRAAGFGGLQGGAWIYLAATFDGNRLRAYKNGGMTEEASPSNTNPQGESQTAKIGRHAFDTDKKHFFDGMVDEVRISVLPQTQSWIAAQNKSMRDDNFVNFGGMEMVSVMLP